jgi:hypothetical protein
MANHRCFAERTFPSLGVHPTTRKRAFVRMRRAASAIPEALRDVTAEDLRGAVRTVAGRDRQLGTRHPGATHCPVQECLPARRAVDPKLSPESALAAPGNGQRAENNDPATALLDV